MEKRINLIPLEMAVPARAVKLAKLLNKLSVVGIVVFIVSVVTVISLLVFYSFELKNVTIATNQLKSRVVELEKNEQKLYLAKNRIEKIAEVRKLQSVAQELVKFQGLTRNMALYPDSTYSEIIISPAKSELTVFSKSSIALSEVLKLITDLVGYKNIVLSSLGFSPTSGYTSSFVFNNK
jgi:hypothetical protein